MTDQTTPVASPFGAPTQPAEATPAEHVNTPATTEAAPVASAPQAEVETPKTEAVAPVEAKEETHTEATTPSPAEEQKVESAPVEAAEQKAPEAAEAKEEAPAQATAQSTSAPLKEPEEGLVERTDKLGNKLHINKREVELFDAQEAKITDVTFDTQDVTPRVKCTMSIDNGMLISVDSTDIEKIWAESDSPDKPDEETFHAQLKNIIYNDVRRGLDYIFRRHQELLRLLSDRNVMTYHQAQMQYDAAQMTEEEKLEAQAAMEAQSQSQEAKTAENEATAPAESTATQSTPEAPTQG